MTMPPDFGESDSPRDLPYEFIWTDVVIVAAIIGGLLWLIL